MNSVAKAVVSGSSIPSMMDRVAGAGSAASAAAVGDSRAAAAAADADDAAAAALRQPVRCRSSGRWCGCSWTCTTIPNSHGVHH